MAHLADIFATEKDKVNCPFYYKIGVCRHGDRCSRIHLKPVQSQTLLFRGLWQNPAAKISLLDGESLDVDEKAQQEQFEEFYEDIFLELQNFGTVEEMHVVDNLGDHMIGNVYAKFSNEDEAHRCGETMQGRYYAGRPLLIELSPVTNFREARCRQFDVGECTRSNFCNFLHLKKISPALKRKLYPGGRRSRSRSRSPPGRGRSPPPRYYDRDRPPPRGYDSYGRDRSPPRGYPDRGGYGRDRSPPRGYDGRDRPPPPPRGAYGGRSPPRGYGRSPPRDYDRSPPRRGGYDRLSPPRAGYPDRGTGRDRSPPRGYGDRGGNLGRSPPRGYSAGAPRPSAADRSPPPRGRSPPRGGYAADDGARYERDREGSPRRPPSDRSPPSARSSTTAGLGGSGSGADRAAGDSSAPPPREGYRRP